MTNQQNSNTKTKRRDKRKKMKTPLKVLIIILLCLLIILGTLFSTFLILKNIGKSRLTPNNNNLDFPSDIIEAMENNGEIIYNKGQKYVLNENIVSFICVGIDKKNITDNYSNGEAGQADSIALVALDTSKKTIKILPISRETMVDINVYSTTGQSVGIEKKQLCLAYSYGTGNNSSCENLKTSVSRLLYGMDIKSYFAIESDGVKELTNKIGGVKLVALETLQNSTYSIYANQEVNLMGGEAVFYISGRNQDLNANQKRMARQKQFMNALIKKCGQNVLSNFTNLFTYYNTVKPYSVTNFNLSDITYIASEFLSSKLLNSITYLKIDGKTVLGEDNHTQFIPNSDSLYNAVIDIFYTKEET